MACVPTDDATKSNEIEFLDDVAAADDASMEAVVSGGSVWRWLALGAVLLTGSWLVISAGADALDETPAASPPPAEAADLPPAGTTTAGPPINPPVFGLWPTPPTNRDPNVVITIASAELPDAWSAFSLGSTTLVYVNASGVPTVVSFETGEIARVEVAAIRVHETFGVADGRVVSLANGVDHAVEPIVFHTYRDVDRPGVGTMSDQRGVGRGPELCLSSATCALPGLGVERVQQGGFVAERYDLDRHPVIGGFLTEWQLVDQWLESPEGYRMPAPVGVVWVIRPPSGGSASSSGVL